MNILTRRNPLRRTALGVAALALSAATLTACGGDDSDAGAASATPSESASESPSESPSETPTESPSAEASDTAAPAESSEPARVQKFCSIYSDLFTQVSAAMTSTGGFASVLPQLRDFGDQLKAVGLPDDAPADAKTGLDINLKVIDDLPDNATEQDLVTAGQSVTADEQADAQAFGQYILSACPDLVPQVGASPAS